LGKLKNGMKVESRKEGNTIVVSVSGRLEANTTGSFDAAILSLISDGKNLLINLTDLDYISSAGLRSILTAAKKVQESQGELALSSPTEMVKEVLDMSGFSAIINIYPDCVSACAQM
jgi:stage II sporulation protein AA (anti-sigma F factor antagonist)